MLNNVTSTGQQNETVQRGAPAQGNRWSENQSSRARPSAVETPRQMFTSQPPTYSMATSNLRMLSSSTAFVGPCFICQLVGHRGVDCPRRVCYSCGQKGHLARDCPARQNMTTPPPKPAPRCQSCGKDGVTIKECPNCIPIISALGNGATRTQ